MSLPDFPPNPSVGDTYRQWIFDGTSWACNPSLPAIINDSTPTLNFDPGDILFNDDGVVSGVSPEDLAETLQSYLDLSLLASELGPLITPYLNLSILGPAITPYLNFTSLAASISPYLNFLPLTGGTVTGQTNFNNQLRARASSATTPAFSAGGSGSYYAYNIYQGYYDGLTTNPVEWRSEVSYDRGGSVPSSIRYAAAHIYSGPTQSGFYMGHNSQSYPRPADNQSPALVSGPTGGIMANAVTGDASVSVTSVSSASAVNITAYHPDPPGLGWSEIDMYGSDGGGVYFSSGQTYGININGGYNGGGINSYLVVENSVGHTDILGQMGVNISTSSGYDISVNTPGAATFFNGTAIAEYGMSLNPGGSVDTNLQYYHAFGWNGNLLVYLNRTYQFSIPPTVSDRSLKRDIDYSSESLDIIRRLPVHSCYIKKPPTEEEDYWEWSLIADEVENEIPSSVIKVEGELDCINDRTVLYALLKAVQELSDKVERLENEGRSH